MIPFNPSFALIAFIVLLFSLTVHEFSHAWVANLLGDDTARHLGRMTLNPVPHIDPIGTVLVPLMGLFSGGTFFAWAKPVPVNPLRLADPRWGGLKVAAAGPASNLILAAIFALFYHMAQVFPALQTGYVGLFIILMIQFNLLLAVFNLIPLHPLDGSGVLSAFLPTQWAVPYDRWGSRFGALVLIGLFLTGWLGAIVRPPVMVLAAILGVR